ncbi:sulfite exporter TauE/SafE family protein [Herminiimonas sp. CN]|uniref:sulfite exporter TauE/SafE family protein n=1 Tax=Herminiimonas sp. CN TaxID=1349818 RepID=UPI0009E02937|nr:sulfite exporter TauE/SafE family protein [Herminiimonas sp. CN]
MLSAPLVIAALSAGLLGGAHCIGMCGGIATMLGSAGSSERKVMIPIKLQQSDAPGGAWRISALLHAGRIFTYGLLGGVVGALGAAGLLFKPYFPVQMLMFVAGNLALIWLGLRLVGYAPQWLLLDRLGQKIAARVKLPIRFSLAAQTRRRPFLVGIGWGCMPCGLVYGVLPFSLLSGDAFSGAVLMLIFGLGALPYLLFAQGMGQWFQQRVFPAVLRGSAAALLIGIGLFGLWHYDMSGLPAIFCVTPVH